MYKGMTWRATALTQSLERLADGILVFAVDGFYHVREVQREFAGHELDLSPVEQAHGALALAVGTRHVEADVTRVRISVEHAHFEKLGTPCLREGFENFFSYFDFVLKLEK